MRFFYEIVKGLIKENPMFVLVLGTCPTLAVSTSVINALGMGAAVTFVVICSNIIISLIKDIVPSSIRIPIFIVVIAAFVSVVDMTIAAFLPPLHKALGIFIPLIVVNCVILAVLKPLPAKTTCFTPWRMVWEWAWALLCRSR